ncbi:MAG TPA: hypothetical protein VE801_05375, partial [Xanthobacteraceae bacterium]|nr:hypothetical protein [Xanthobacteraceae bacterium]
GIEGSERAAVPQVCSPAPIARSARGRAATGSRNIGPTVKRLVDIYFRGEYRGNQQRAVASNQVGV